MVHAGDVANVEYPEGPLGKFEGAPRALESRGRSEMSVGVCLVSVRVVWKVVTLLVSV